jgi:chemotaxis protein MotB
VFKRATTVVRILQDSYGMNPKRMTAAGRGEFVPLTDNNTAEGRAANRRTRIVIIPQLDQFFKLLERKKINLFFMLLKASTQLKKVDAFFYIDYIS